MSHEHFTKSTKEEVLKMLKMVKEGLSFSEIGRRLGKDHTSIMYWIRKIGPNNIFVDNLEPECAILNIVKKEIPPAILTCQFCNNKQDEKWKKTESHNLICWHNKNKKHESNLYW